MALQILLLCMRRKFRPVLLFLIILSWVQLQRNYELGKELVLHNYKYDTFRTILSVKSNVLLSFHKLLSLNRANDETRFFCLPFTED